VLAAISLDRMAGGLERNISRLANFLAERGADVHLVTFDWETATSFYEIDHRVKWHKVANSPPHAPISFGNRLRLILNMRRILKETGASAIVCFHHGILFRFLMASLFYGIRVVSSERNSLTIYDHVRISKWNLNFIMMFLVDKITVQFPSYIQDYPLLLRKKAVAIPNPVLPADDIARPPIPGDNGRFRLLSVGRLCNQKNYASLITAFANLAPRFPEWDLAIVGNGEISAELGGMAADLGLQDRVHLPGAVTDVSQWYSTSHLFCLPSRWEGFPNALAEALAHGLPSVGYAGCAGVRDLIIDGKNGLLADGNGDAVNLEQALATLMGNAEIRAIMGTASVEGVKQYHPDNVFSLWETMLSEVTGS
jgi:glycosyltransferase involved in cell wall biosynthesis